ncbi:NAD-dependent protein deacetylase-like isoform X2 [Dysidea avara]|uniref:NAD-dependent protein deacetylase-like isoform X2 n=1 Tax=Dysidea avara TaxID=196820 RepID=UPI00332555AD
MAHTARSDEDKKEFFDSPEELEKKGAGVSTSTGIPDFRSGMDTKLETGPGVWELNAHKQARGATHKTTSTTKAIPSSTHMLLVKMQQEGILKGVVSQNTDGLHKRSGLPKKALFELHGNSNLEKCEKCDHEYLRDYRCSIGLRNHLTGRKCDDPKCKGNLKDTIIHFGETLPVDTLEASYQHAAVADLCLVYGSSLTVTPAADIPLNVATRKNSPGDLVIVNLQRTPLDDVASLRIFAKCDDVTQLLAKKLSLDIPTFKLHRKLIVSTTITPKGQRVEVAGTDMEGHPFSYLKRVDFSVEGEVESFNAEPIVVWLKHKDNSMVKIFIQFQGHYGEPTLTISFDPHKEQRTEYSLQYDPFTRTWSKTEHVLEGEVDQLAIKMEQKAQLT